MRKQKTWINRKETPEDIYITPEKYYTKEEVEKYNRSGGIKRTQEKIAYRIIEFLTDENKILDLGCGTGYTMDIYRKQGYDVLGIDIVNDMLEKAREKGLKVIKADMKNFAGIFERNEFDAIVSASAFQWIKDKKDIKDSAKQMSQVLKDNGKIVIQLYTKSQEELENIAKIFKKVGFKGGIIVDNPDNSMKRLCFIVMKKVSLEKKLK
jgi:cyclopropane fatty-acyl-phospholipid synthase-like methyltransferase